MGSSAGRRSAAYVAIRRHYQTTKPPCSLASGPWCTGVGLTVDHDPALSSAPTPAMWRGTYRPACKPCQDRQGADLRNGTGNEWTW